MRMDTKFTLAQIQLAFFKTFHASRELWFSDDEEGQTTDDYNTFYRFFIEDLEEQEKLNPNESSNSC